MKPLNLDNRPCSPISSNCVIWQGPTLDCISLCTGDTISDVVAKMATELCTLLDQTNVTNYDLTCLGITACGPKDFQALIQLLIDKICELQGIPVTEEKTTSGCPDCLVSVAPCFVEDGRTTMQLIDYVQMIANKICDLIASIAELQTQIDNLDIRVTILENTPPPTFTLPSFTVDCTLSDGVIVGGNAYTIDLILNALVNDDIYGYCGLLGATGLPADIISAVSGACITSTTPTLSNAPVPFGTEYLGSWVNTPTTVADAITNIWIVLCDIYQYLQSPTLNVTDTTTVNLTYSSGILSAQVQDTGWLDLNGFSFMASNANRPQCRRIGNEVHFRGYIVIPMGTSNSGGGGTAIPSPTASTYITQNFGYTFNTIQSGNAPDSCLIVTYSNNPWAPVSGPYVAQNTGIGLSFNLGNSVIPSGILSPGQNFDGSYTLGGGTRTIIFRTVRTTGSKNAALHSLGSLSISSTGVLSWGGPLYDESYASDISGWEYSGIGRSMISNPIAGEKVPTFIPAAPSSYNAPTPTFPVTSAVYNSEILQVDDEWAFSQNAGHADQLGGFIIRIDGMKAFIDPCDPVIATPNPC
jgi:hypothetical protein